MLVKNQYQGETDRRAGHGALCYQIRQAFPHGEVTAEEANRIGYETAMRWTKGKYQFFVCTHIDKEHIHNHIYYNSTAYDRSRKFRNFIGSSFALRRLSDRVCLEHDLSVIANPKLHSKGRYLHYGQWLGENQKLSQKEQIRLAIDAALTERPKDFADFLRRMETAGIQVKHGRGGAISFLVPGQQRAARFRAATLGDGYGPEDVQAVIDGKAPTRTATARKAPAPRRVNLLIDIQERMRQGKGPAYERWAKVYNLKQMAAALQYLKEHRLFEYDDLAAKTDAATERFHTLAGDIQQTEAELSHVSDLMAAVVQYAKTRPAFDGYKAAKYSRKYLAEHEAELAMVVGKVCRNLTPEEAEESLFGFTCANDVTAREVQKVDPLIGHCKSYDTFCPIGPWIETELEDINDLSIRCLVNGEVRQSANTGDMIFRPLDLLCFLSRVMTLMPGDVILTGTPPGISPIQADDVVQVSIEGIGTLSNPVEGPGPEEKILQ